MDSTERFFADHYSAEEDEYDDVVVEEYVEEFFLHFASDDPQPEMRHYMFFRHKNTKIFLERGHSPLTRLIP